MPCRQELAQGRRLDGLDFTTQAGQRAPPQPAQHLDVDPVVVALIAWPVRAPAHPVGLLESSQHFGDCGLGETDRRRHLTGGEGSVSACIASDNVAKWVGDRLQQ